MPAKILPGFILLILTKSVNATQMWLTLCLFSAGITSVFYSFFLIMQM